ncbi:hypothetical protein CQW23_14734 [Capsicum baccatum]|uniref:RNase H type-1 domain-containing protein n=1 Tax=Capsicum baccatum TaxID=33114 RepID=A0A2G2WK03_CAPBA|nr:hypothetical protein CQW23_14734 [Capsicum baccatum]
MVAEAVAEPVAAAPMLVEVSMLVDMEEVQEVVKSNEPSDKNIRSLAMSSSTNNKLPAQQNTTNPPLESVDNNMPTTASIIGGIPNLEHSLSLDKDRLFNIVRDNPEILQALKKAIISKSKSTPQSYENPNSQTHATEIRGENQQEKVSSAKQKHSDPKISSNFDPPSKNKTPPNQIAPNTQAITTANDTQISNNTAQTNNTDDDTQVQTKIGTGKVKSSVPSKSTFAAAVQEALAAKDESASNINIKHGKAIGPDQATYSKSRGNMAKVKIEIDLLQPKQDNIWLGFNRIDGTEDEQWLKVEYEEAPTYCYYYEDNISEHTGKDLTTEEEGNDGTSTDDYESIEEKNIDSDDEAEKLIQTLTNSNSMNETLASSNTFPKVIIEDDNQMLGDPPTLDEIKEAESVPGPDGTQLPISLTHTCLILLPKVENPQRLMNNKLPIDEALQKFRIHGPSKCNYCKTESIESVDHLFSGGYLTAVKARCNHKYEDIKSSSDTIINRVIYQIRMLVACQFPQVQLKQQWRNTLLHIENLKSRINIKCLRWRRPISGRFKLNTDGCSKKNPKSAGGCGVLRDENGQMIMAYSEYYGECSNNIVDSKAILCGITWCMKNGFKDVNIESDSMLVVKMINEQTTIHFILCRSYTKSTSLRDRVVISFNISIEKLIT